MVATALRRTAPAEGWLVDAGGGAGGVTALLGWDRDRVAVVEGSPELVGQARTAHGLVGLQGGVDALPLGDGSVSVLCLLDVIEHLDDPVASPAGGRAVLAADGRVVVNVPEPPVAVERGRRGAGPPPPLRPAAPARPSWPRPGWSRC